MEDDLYMSQSKFDKSVEYSATDYLYSWGPNIQNENDESTVSQFATAYPVGVASTSHDIPNDNIYNGDENPLKQNRIMQKRKIHMRKVSESLANKRKSNYAGGRAYLCKKGKYVPSKILKAPCTCRMKCFLKVPNSKREDIFQFYWDEKKDYNMKRQFIVSCVEAKPISRRRNRLVESFKFKSNTFVYSFVIDNRKITVCKTMFLNTLSISQSVVTTALAKRLEGGR